MLKTPIGINLVDAPQAAWEGLRASVSRGFCWVHLELLEGCIKSMYIILLVLNLHIPYEFSQIALF